jgi:IS66 C-terminal element
MNAVDPQVYLRDVLTKIVASRPMSRIDELLPFAYASAANRGGGLKTPLTEGQVIRCVVRLRALAR